MPNRRFAMLLIVVVALLAWLGLGLYGKLVAPSSTLPRLLFLLILLAALTATFTPLAWLIDRRLVHTKAYADHSLQNALRQGVLMALAIVANLTLKVLDAWFWPDIILIGLTAVLVEIVALTRK